MGNGSVLRCKSRYTVRSTYTNATTVVPIAVSKHDHSMNGLQADTASAPHKPTCFDTYCCCWRSTSTRPIREGSCGCRLLLLLALRFGIKPCPLLGMLNDPRSVLMWYRLTYGSKSPTPDRWDYSVRGYRLTISGEHSPQQGPMPLNLQKGHHSQTHFISSILFNTSLLVD